MPNLYNLIGHPFGRLIVIERAPNRGRHTHWLCECDCGGTTTVNASSLVRGLTQSCGCLRRERARGVIERNRPVEGANLIHGLSSSPEYNAWSAMKRRCLNPNSTRYERWGGRGITISPDWVDSFKNFLADMGGRPSAKHSLDRIDNDGDYEPGNCRWATPKEQRNNRSDKIS